MIEEQNKKRMHKAILIMGAIGLFISIIVVSFIIIKSMYVANADARLVFSGLGQNETTVWENCTLSFKAHGGEYDSHGPQLVFRLNFPHFCTIEVLSMEPQFENRNESGYVLRGNTVELTWEDFIEGQDYSAELKVTWRAANNHEYFRYFLSFNHCRDYGHYVLPDEHSTFNYNTDFIIYGFAADEYQYKMFIDDKRVEWHEIWEGTAGCR